MIRAHVWGDLPPPIGSRPLGLDSFSVCSKHKSKSRTFFAPSTPGLRHKLREISRDLRNVIAWLLVAAKRNRNNGCGRQKRTRVRVYKAGKITTARGKKAERKKPFRNIAVDGLCDGGGGGHGKNKRKRRDVGDSPVTVKSNSPTVVERSRGGRATNLAALNTGGAPANPIDLPCTAPEHALLIIHVQRPSCVLYDVKCSCGGKFTRQTRVISFCF